MGIISAFVIKPVGLLTITSLAAFHENHLFDSCYQREDLLGNMVYATKMFFIMLQLLIICCECKKSTHKCPPPMTQCACTKVTSHQMVIDCNRKEIHTVPVATWNNTDVFRLQDNRLKTVNFTSPVYQHLNELDLSYNQLEHLDEDAFLVLHQLKKLSLAFNRLIHYHNAYAFKPLGNLVSLDLGGNCRQVVGVHCSYPDQIQYLVALQELRIDGYGEKPLSPCFGKLDNLTSLTFTGNCLIDRFSIRIFENINVSRIQKLTLDHCSLVRLERGTFSYFRGLERLNISNSRRLCAGGLRNITAGLNKTSITELILVRICDNCLIEYPAVAFEGLRGSKLRSLQWVKNAAYSIELQAITNLPNETLTNVTFREAFMKGFKNLLLLSLVRLGNLSYVDFSHERSTTQLQDVRVSSHKPQNLDDLCTSFNCTFYLPKRLQTIIFKNINHNLRTRLSNIYFNQDNSLKTLDLSGGSTSEFLAVTHGLKHLEELNASKSHITKLNYSCFENADSLSTLDLSSNSLAFWFQNSSGIHIFKQKLKRLKLCRNEIKVLPPGFLGNQQKMERLNLCSNHVEEINFRLNNMTSLINLNLQDNQIKYLTKANMDDLDEIASTSPNLTVNIKKNPILCQCNQSDFIRWLSVTKVNFIRLSYTNCTFENGSVLSLKYKTEISDLLMTSCISVIVTTGCVFGAVILCLILTIVAVVYENRRRLMYLYYMSKSKVNPYEPLDASTSLRNAQYDVYISYEEDFDMEDGTSLRHFVLRRLRDALETKGLATFLRSDITAGASTHCEITKAVSKSRKVVALVTSNYFKCDLNMYEFNMAAFQGVYTKRNLLLPIQMCIKLYPADVSNEEALRFLTGNTLYRCPPGTEADKLADFIYRQVEELK